MDISKMSFHDLVHELNMQGIMELDVNGLAMFIFECVKDNQKLKEALEDIARGPLQNSDFSTYCVQKAKHALGDKT